MQDFFEGLCLSDKYMYGLKDSKYHLTLTAAHPAFRKTKCFVLCFTFPFLLFLSYNTSWGQSLDPVQPV